jgi:hypothetical protein
LTALIERGIRRRLHAFADDLLTVGLHTRRIAAAMKLGGITA